MTWPASEKGLRISDKESADHAYLYGCTFKDNQLWKHEDGQIVHKATGKCLAAASLTEDQPLQITTCDSSKAQKWKFKFKK